MVEFYSSRILNFAGRMTPESEFVQYCKGNDIKVFTAQICNQQSLRVLEDDPIFRESLESSLISFFSESGPFNGKKHERVKAKYIDICIGVYKKTLEILENDKGISKIFVPNGRMADQRTFLIASKRQIPNIEIKYFEKGYQENFFYVGEQSLLDRVAMQSEIRKSNYSPYLSVASNFFELRRVDQEANEFIAGWKDVTSAENIEMTAPRITFFNSSNDEFMSLGSEWNDSEWSSQWEAFEQVANYFLQDDYAITIRMHPNGVNKSKRERSRERVALARFKKKFPTITVYDPQEKVNSYMLISQSDLIVVWNSTIGLEASYMGKPVVCLNASEWDLSVPIYRVRNITDLHNLSKTMPNVGKEEALKYIAGRISLDRPLYSNHFKNRFLKLEKEDPFFRLARIMAGARKFKLKNFFKIFFSSRSTPLYQFLKKISSRI